MFYAARWQQSAEPRVVRCVTSLEGSWSACATFASALARPRWPARGLERTAWSRDSFRNRKSYSNSLKKSRKKRFALFKEKLSARKPERKKNFESSSEIFLNQFSKSHLSALIRHSSEIFKLNIWIFNFIIFLFLDFTFFSNFDNFLHEKILFFPIILWKATLKLKQPSSEIGFPIFRKTRPTN